MRDPHPLAIIPLQKDLLLSVETSSNSSDGNSPRAGGVGDGHGEQEGGMAIRTLVPHRSSSSSSNSSSGPVVTAAAERGESPLRSEDDTALMRSLISLMPHERADSQFSVTSPVRRSDRSSDRAVRHQSWFRSGRPNTSALDPGGKADGACGSDDGGEGKGEGGRGGGRRRSSNGSSSSSTGGGRGGLDFLGTTESVRELFHLPFTSEAVSVGLHRVGQTLVLDGNLDQVLAPAAAAAAAAAAATAAKAPVSAPPAPPPASSSSNPIGGGIGNSSSSNSNINDDTVVGGGEKEGRWVMVGRGGKPRQPEGDGGEQGWRRYGHEEGGGYSAGDSTAPSGAPKGERRVNRAGAAAGRGQRSSSPAAAAVQTRKNAGKGWEPESRGRGRSGGGTSTGAGGRSREGLTPCSSCAGRESSTTAGGQEEEEWSVTDQGNWPALGAPDAAATAASSSGEDAALVVPGDPGSGGGGGGGGGILSLVPSRPRAQSFGVRPPEPVGFWRSFEWELAGMHLVLGSSLPVCSTAEHPQVSVRLHDGDEDLSLCTCLDYYLDNVMENVPELALCMREKGYIQGCRVVSTEDIPYLSSMSRKPAAATATEGAPQNVGAGGGGVGVGTPVPMFDPDVVELNATMLLRFLQENCSREGGTYLLHRSEGAAHVQLYDVSALSRQRHRRWKWLLAMLCYRFALRISHHTRRQFWGRGGRPAAGRGTAGGRTGNDPGTSSSSSDFEARGPLDVSPSAGPEVVRQLQRRQRQLLENSLELLEELAELGGGGHETICASVQEHIADTYLGTHGALPRPGSTTTSTSSSRGQSSAGGGTASTQKAGVWTADSGGEVWTSPPPLRAPGAVAGSGGGKADGAAAGAAATAAQKKRRQRGDGSRRNGAARKSGGAEGKAGGGSHPGSVRIGGGGDGDGRDEVLGEERGRADMDKTGEREREENLDRAQDHLTSGIAILHGVMARQESAAAGRDDSATADVVIVGERKRPVAIMRQQRNPWVAVDDEDDDTDYSSSCDEEQAEDEGQPGMQDGGQGGRQQQQRQRLGRGPHRRRRRRRRRGSLDESGDPATALSVVSEQLWGLQQKLVGTYVAVARARLRRAFPDPPLVAAAGDGPASSSSSSPSPSSGRKGTNDGGNGGGGGRRTSGRSASRASKASREAAADATNATCGVKGKEAAAARGSGGQRQQQREDGPDDETRAELVRGALDSLCAAWENLAEAKVTLDRRSSAAVVAVADGDGDGDSQNEEEDRHDDDDGEGQEEWAAAAAATKDDGPSEGGSGGGGGGGAQAAARRWRRRQDDRAEELGPLWKGSLSEALARDSRDAAAAAAADVDVMGRLAWTRAARRQLEARRAELFELCGDVAHACVSLRAKAVGVGIATAAAAAAAAAAATAAGPSTGEGGSTEAQRGLSARLQELLSSASPPLALGELNVCGGLHGRVWETLTAEGGDDPRPLAETCIHSLARAGRAPGDPTTWSLCLAAEACYDRALLGLDKVVAGVLDNRHPDGGIDATTAGAVTAGGGGGGKVNAGNASFVSGVPEARARIRKKLGDASNELGKLMAQCAGVLVQAPPPPPSPPRSEALDPKEGGGERPAAASSSSRLEPAGAAAKQQPPVHPGLGCAVCVASADAWFRRSLAQFRAIGDARNVALLLCNLASVERLKPRALARLGGACPRPAGTTGRLAVPGGAPGSGGSGGSGGGGGRGKSGGRPVSGKGGGSGHLRGAAAAVELCGEAHSALGRRDEDERTWDHASAELAMAYLCLGVERRQELLGALLQAGEATEGAADTERGPSARPSATASVGPSSVPTAAQARGVVGPLEQALRIYTDMKNAPQAAACHYQIGQYYAKILPVYAAGTDSAASCEPTTTNSPGRSDGGGGGSGPSSALRVAKAWEAGQRAARHFLAARAYFAPFEHGPTSVILALDLCNLYLFLAEMGGGPAAAAAAAAAAAGGSGGSEYSSHDGGSDAAAVPIPSVAGGDAAEAEGSHRLRPTAAARFRCLEGALRCLLDTRAVFADAGVDIKMAGEAAGQRQQQERLRRLLESVTGCLPKVMQALVRASVAIESSSSSPSSSPSPPATAAAAATAAFKSMYKRSLTATRGGGEGAQAMLAGLAVEYGAVVTS